jgi:hypothetical protein
MSIDQLQDIEYGLTVQDPWAQAIIWGPKRIENRGKRPPEKIIGERIAVYTGKTVDLQAVHAAWHGKPLDGWGDYYSKKEHHHPGHIIGTVRVQGFYEPGGDWEMRGGFRAGSEWEWLVSAIFDANDSARAAQMVEDDPWWQGPAGWLLDDPQPLDEPVPARGFPGVWNVERQVEVAE